jgi:hypothetical protein
LTLGTTTAAEGRFAIAISPEKLAHAESLDVLVRRIGYSECRGVITVRRGDALDIRFWVSPAAVRLSEAVSMSTLAEAVNEQITNTQHAGVDEGDIVSSPVAISSCCGADASSRSTSVVRLRITRRYGPWRKSMRMAPT